MASAPLLASWLLEAGEGLEGVLGACESSLASLVTERLESIEHALHESEQEPQLPTALLRREVWRSLFFSLHGSQPHSRLVRLGLSSLASAGDAAAAAALGEGASALVERVVGEAVAERLAGGRGAGERLLALGTADEASAAHAAVVLGGLVSAALRSDGDPAVSPELLAMLQHARAELAAAATARGLDVHRWELLASGVPAHSPFMACCLSILKSDSLSPADVASLHTLVSRCDDDELETAVSVLRSPSLLRPLLGPFFGARARGARKPDVPQGETRDALLNILAMVSSGQRKTGKSDGAWELSRKAIAEASIVCMHAPLGDLLAYAPLLFHTAADAAAGVGLVLWAHAGLTSMHVGGGASLDVDVATLHLAVLMECAGQHPALTRQACAVLAACLPLETAESEDSLAGATLKRKLLDCTLELLVRGCVAPAMEALHAFVGNATDRSLIRHVALRLVALVTLPCSEDFAREMMRLLSLTRMREAVSAAAAAQRQTVSDAVRQLSGAHPQLAEASAWFATVEAR